MNLAIRRIAIIAYLALGICATLGCGNGENSAETKDSSSTTTRAKPKLERLQIPAATQTESEHGMVVSVSSDASDVGRDVLKQGGNAVDAAVAVAFALAVVHPEAGNIGGGGFMMVYRPDEAVECVDYRETAPGAATPEMFGPDASRYSHLAVGVPGTVRGLALAHERYGRLEWKKLVDPAVQLAEKGFVVDAVLADGLNSILKRAEKDKAELRRVYGKPGDGQKWTAGDRLTLPDLAATLRQIADEGPSAFYAGKIARQLVEEMKQEGGVISAEDLAGYQARIRPAIHGTFRGYDIYGPPPPSAGGICLVEMLNILETFDLKASGRWSPETVHRICETMKRVYCDRARYLGDSDFVEIPAHLTDKEYAKKLAATIDMARATASETLAPEITIADESPDTTHFSVVDADGLAVSNTYTLEQSYGSRVVVRGAGFLLNNEMGDFNWRPGHTDRGGAIGTAPNIIAPGKRMLSSQTPTIVARGGKLVLVVGSPGGRTITNTVLNVVLNVLEFDMPIDQAIAAPRLHHQWLPDSIYFEGLADPQYAPLVKRLRSLGHSVKRRGLQGDVHAVFIDADKRIGAADGRIRGAAAGF